MFNFFAYERICLYVRFTNMYMVGGGGGETYLYILYYIEYK